MGDVNTDSIEMNYPISLIGDVVFTASDTSERPLLNSLLVFQVL